MTGVLKDKGLYFLQFANPPRPIEKTMTPNEIIKLIHDRKDLCKIWRKLSLEQRREVLRREGEIKERLEEARTGQRKLF